MIMIAAFAASSIALTGSAQDAFRPQSDYRMATTVEADGHQVPMVMRHSDGRMRLETVFQGQEAVILMNLHTETATILIDAQGMRMAMEIPSSEADFVPEAPDEMPEPIGSDVVAGEPCDIYRVDDSDTGEPGDVCITDDAIILRVETGTGVVFEAEEFERASQDPSLFEVPEGYQRMQMPGGMSPGRR